METKKETIFNLEVVTLSKRFFDQMPYTNKATPDDIQGEVNYPTDHGMVLPILLAKLGERYYRVRTSDLCQFVATKKLATAPPGTYTYADICNEVDAEIAKLPQIYLK
jgi:hypothetical protein